MTDEGENLALKTGITFIETSAQNGGNVEEAFQQLVRQVIEQKNKQVNNDVTDKFEPLVVISSGT